MGCADVAERRVLPAVRDVPGITLTAVASRHRGKAEAFTGRWGGTPVQGYEELLHRDDVQAVYIPLPSGLHREWVERALRAGKHVLVEKPLTTSHAGTAALADLATAAGLVLLENFMFLQHSQHTIVRELIAAGEIGDPLVFDAVFAIPPRPPGDIRHRPELGGGALLDNCGYPVRAAQLLFGPGWEVRGAVADLDPELGVDLGGGALLRHRDGVVGHVTFGLRHAYVSRYEIIGSHSRLLLERPYTPPAEHAPVLVLERQGDVKAMTLPVDDQCANTVALFRDAVTTGRLWREQVAASVRHALLMEQIAATARQPASTG
jgi:predicted dehydrogenase